MPAVVQAAGAVAGVAGLVGLTVLTALHCAQARDVKRLREWAGTAPERSGPRMTARPERSGTRMTARPQRSRSRPARTGVRAAAIALVSLLVLVFAATRLTGTSHDTKAKGFTKPKRTTTAAAVTPTAAAVTPSAAAVTPSDVTVAVLNGTTVPGLAATLRERVAAAGFSKGMINDFSDQQRATSVVQYAPGQQAAAQAVGRTLGVSAREPITADSRALAGDAAVIVIAGVDQAP